MGHLVLAGVSAAPNPVDPRNGELLAISFSLNAAAKVTVLIYDKQLRKVYEAVNLDFGPGSGQVAWNGRTSKGTCAPPGEYVVTVIATDGITVASGSVGVSVQNKGGQTPGSGAGRGGRASSVHSPKGR